MFYVQFFLEAMYRPFYCSKMILNTFSYVRGETPLFLLVEQ
jgi:hypothetical protein